MVKFNHDTTGIETVKHFKSEVDSKTIVVTGTSAGGLGAETAISLAHADPAQIVLLARSEKKVKPVRDEISKLNSKIKVTIVPIELDNLESVGNAAKMIDGAVDKIDILINNAGIMGVKEYTKNKHGIESQFATNHLGHFVLTALVANKIRAAGTNARIINLSSQGHLISAVRFDDYNFSDGSEYDPWSAYGQAKTANTLFSKGLAEKGITSFSVHPGVIFDTSLGNHLEKDDFNAIAPIAMRNTGATFQLDPPKSTQQGVSTTLRAALDPSLASQSGAYMEDANVKETFEYATSAENAQKLWILSEKLTGQKFDL